MLLFAVLLVACGDDDDADTDVAPTATTAAAATTAPAEADEESTPTEAAEATPTTEPEPTEPVATPTEEAIATPTEDADTAAGTPTADSDSTPEADETPAAQAADPEVEAELFEIVLSEEDLPTGWTGPGATAASEDPSDEGICNAEPFAGIDERLASVETEFEQDPQQGPFLIQNLAAYPEDLAVEAMEYAREVTTDCTEWTDDEGTAYTLERQDDYPEFGDESFVARITFEVPGVGEVPGEFVFARVGGLLTFIGYIQIGEIDPAVVEDLATLAIEKMEDAEQ